MNPQSARKVGFIAALEAEARSLAPDIAWHAPEELRPLRDGALLCVTGMGFDAAARGASRLAEAGCTALASWGLAGALDPALSAGAVVVPESILLDGAQPIDASVAWRAQVVRALPAAVGGMLLTSHRALATIAAKQSAYQRTGAAAVDMESYAIAAVARVSGLPFLSVRVIVDTAADEVPEALADATDGAGRIAVGRLIAHLATSPGLLGPLLRLAGRYRAARASMRAVGRTGLIGSRGADAR